MEIDTILTIVGVLLIIYLRDRRMYRKGVRDGYTETWRNSVRRQVFREKLIHGMDAHVPITDKNVTAWAMKERYLAMQREGLDPDLPTDNGDGSKPALQTESRVDRHEASQSGT